MALVWFAVFAFILLAPAVGDPLELRGQRILLGGGTPMEAADETSNLELLTRCDI